MRPWIVLLFTSALLRAQEPAPAADELLESLRALRRAEAGERAAAVEHVLTLQPDGERVRALLAGGRVEGIAPAIGAGWHVREATGASGVKRPYQLYLPSSRAGSDDPLPLLVVLHGGVSRPAFLVEPGVVGSMWTGYAEEEGFAIACPLGRADTTWWNDAGVDAVHAAIRDAKRVCPIDDDRIVVTGFSDGGSGSYYLAMAAPDPFAAFLPLNGHPAVAARAGARPLYLRNLLAAPMFVAMTQDDPLYPAFTVVPHLVPVLRADGPMRLVCWPDGGHTPSYFPAMGDAFVDYALERRRDPWPTAIDWWCSETALGRRAWVEVLAIGPADGDAAPLEDLNVMSTPGRVLIGVGIDRAHEGFGVKVESVQENSVAAGLGMRPGDVITGVDDAVIGTLGDLGAALAAKTFGDRVRLFWTRGDEPLDGEGTFPPFTPEPIYLRDGPVARVSARAEPGRIELVTRNVRRLRLSLPPAWLAETALEVVANGVAAKHKVRVVPLAEQLARYAAAADGSALPVREVVVELPPATPPSGR